MTLILYIRRLSYHIISMLILIYITEPRDILCEWGQALSPVLRYLNLVIYVYIFIHIYINLYYVVLGYVRNQMKCFCYRDVLFDSPTFTAISEG